MQRTTQSHGPAERANIMAAVRRGLEVGRRVGVTARECGITEATYYRWVRERARASSRPVRAAESQEAAPSVDAYEHAVRRGRLPAEMREQLQSRAIVLRREGGLAADAIAERLGVSQSTVSRWLAGRSQEAGFVQVSVVTDAPEPAPAHAVPVLVAPGGYRVEGLDVASLADLLRRLA